MEQQQRTWWPVRPVHPRPPPDARLLAEQRSAASVLAARYPLVQDGLILTMFPLSTRAFPTEPLRVPGNSGWKWRAVAALHSSTWRFPGQLTGLVSVLLSLRGKGSPGRGQRREWPGGAVGAHAVCGLRLLCSDAVCN